MGSITLLIAAAVFVVGMASDGEPQACTALQANAGKCSISRPIATPNPNDPSITIGGTATIEGSSDDTGGGVTEVDGVDPRCLLASEINVNGCPPPAEGTPAVTLTDIATFRPTAAIDHMQPNGWTVAGLDTNFYATGARHVVDGTLLGQPASVRFTPVAWSWDYGDGTGATRTVPGRPWSARSDEFNPTATSHVYLTKGPFTIRLTVNFAAEYRFAGGPWTPIRGTLAVPSPDLQISVGSAKTVLVHQNCSQNPRGPGC